MHFYEQANSGMPRYVLTCDEFSHRSVSGFYQKSRTVALAPETGRGGLTKRDRKAIGFRPLVDIGRTRRMP
jgi:hypothetical protein